MIYSRTPLFDLPRGSLADITVAGGGSSTNIQVTDGDTPVIYSDPTVTGEGDVTITVNSLQPGYKLGITTRLIPKPTAPAGPVIPADAITLTSGQPYANPDGESELPAGTVLHYVLKAQTGITADCNSGVNNTTISATLTGPSGATATGEGRNFPLSLDDGAGNYLLTITLSGSDGTYTTMTAH